MIAKFNRKQTIVGFCNLVAGLMATAAAAAFFYFVARFVLINFSIPNGQPISIGFAIGGLLVVFVSGLRLQCRGEGNYGYQDSDLMPRWEGETAGSVAVDYYRNRVTAPAHALTQLFLCAPLQLLKAVSRFSSLIKASPGLDDRLVSVLAEINQQDKWQSVSDYPEKSAELQYLIKARA